MVGTEGIGLYIVCSLMQVLVFFIYLKENFGLKKNLYSVPFWWIFSEILANLIFIPMHSLIMNVLFNYTNHFLIACFFAKGSLKKKAVLVGLYFCVMVLNEPLWSIIIVQLGLSDAQDIANNYVLVYAIYFISAIVQLLFVWLISFVFKKRFFSAVGQRRWIGVVVITLCSFGAGFIQVVNMIKYSDYTWIYLLSIIMLMVIDFVSYYYFLMEEDKYRIELEYKSYEEQVKMYSQWIEEQKQTHNAMEAFRHDMKNHISALKGICKNVRGEGEKGAIEEIDKYLDNIGINYSIMKNEVNSGNVLVDSILNMKLNYAVSIGISVDSEIRIPKDWLYDSMDMVIILGNLLDNAIEACGKPVANVHKKLYIELCYDKGNLFIRLENTYNGGLDDNIGTTNEDWFIKTTKRNKKRHGIGMKNIAAVVNKYNGVMRWKAENKVFHTEILLYGVEEASNKKLQS